MECPYHHSRWRSQTQQLMNLLRGKLGLNGSRMKRFNKAVCMCDDQQEESTTLQSTPDHTHWLETVSHDHTAFCNVVCSILNRYLTAARDQSEKCAGLVGVVTVIKEVSLGDYHQLDHPPSSSSSSSLRPKAVLEEWDLALPPQYTSFLIGKGGHKIQRLCKEHSVTAFFGKMRGTRYRQSANESSVKVTVRGKVGVADMVGFKKKLTELSKTVEVKRRRHEQKVLAFHQMLSKRREAREAGLLLQPFLDRFSQRVQVKRWGMSCQSSKDAATDVFERKQQQRLKSKHPSKPTPHAAIADGHCLHCLSPYTPHQAEEGACTFHSGFLVPVKPGKHRGYRWTCCRRRTAHHPCTPDMHTRTGCSTGRHTWRAGKTVPRKSRGNKGSSYQDIYLT